MAPLQYSGMDTFIGKDADLSLDFNTRTWTLQNAYHYGEDGHIALEKGNRGLCGSLARYIYWQIKPLFDPRHYLIKICRVKEKDYFSAPSATHIILLVIDKDTGEEYLIDPTFKRYILKGAIDDYEFLSTDDPEIFIKANRLKDKFFYVNSASPLLIKDNYLLSFAVETVNGRFDAGNLVLTLKASPKRSNTSQYIFVLCLYQGKARMDKNDQLLDKLLEPQERKLCLDQMDKWFRRMVSK